MAQQKPIARTETSPVQQIEQWNTFRDMERMFRDFFLSPFPMLRTPGLLAMARQEVLPEIDLRETDNEIIFSATVPGLSKDDIDINVTSDSITISGERKQTEEKPGERIHVRQQSYGSFQVCYSLPANVKPDKVKATYKNGVLEVMMPKAEVKQAHKVSVEGE